MKVEFFRWVLASKDLMDLLLKACGGDDERFDQALYVMQAAYEVGFNEGKRKS